MVATAEHEAAWAPDTDDVGQQTISQPQSETTAARQTSLHKTCGLTPWAGRSAHPAEPWDPGTGHVPKNLGMGSAGQGSRGGMMTSAARPRR